jgi:hypothetical protein
MLFFGNQRTRNAKNEGCLKKQITQLPKIALGMCLLVSGVFKNLIFGINCE